MTKRDGGVIDPVVPARRMADPWIAVPRTPGSAAREAFSGGARNRLDGVKFIWKDQRVRVRASGTEAVVRIVAETPTETRAEALAAFAVDAAERSRSAGISA